MNAAPSEPAASMGNDLLDLIMGGGGGSPPISAANHQPVAAAPTSIGGGGLDDLLATPTHGKSLMGVRISDILKAVF